MGVDERWKEKFGVWIVKTPDDIAQKASRLFALLVTCTHLGCTPNYLQAEGKFKCPCHGSGFRAATGINFEGPAPGRSSAAASRSPRMDSSSSTSPGSSSELGQWADPEAFLKA